MAVGAGDSMRRGRHEVPQRLSRDEQGFTLAEIMAVMAIIGILLLIAIASYIPATNAANSAACRANQRTLTGAVQLASAADLGTVDELEDLRPYVRNLDAIAVCPSDATPLIFNAATSSVTCPNHL
jgi:prepilin-type N-terminal cleavage/methylation domain-containing protein